MFDDIAVVHAMRLGRLGKKYVGIHDNMLSVWVYLTSHQDYVEGEIGVVTGEWSNRSCITGTLCMDSVVLAKDVGDGL